MSATTPGRAARARDRQVAGDRHVAIGGDGEHMRSGAALLGVDEQIAILIEADVMERLVIAAPETLDPAAGPATREFLGRVLRDDDRGEFAADDIW
jgi:hypothetical protein